MSYERGRHSTYTHTTHMYSRIYTHIYIHTHIYTYMCGVTCLGGETDGDEAREGRVRAFHLLVRDKLCLNNTKRKKECNV
jgi:hypothetical protein